MIGNLPSNVGDVGLMEKKWQLTSVFLPGESHEQRRLAGYSPWGGKSQTKLSG